MSDRVIRDELWKSERWLGLPTDTHRLVYIGLIPMADDYGNFEGGPRRMYRWMQGHSQVKTESDALRVMSDLQDADMVRRYEIEGKEYWHLPRFSNSRRYWARKCPPSPYPEQERKTSKQTNQAPAKNPAAIHRQSAAIHSTGKASKHDSNPPDNTHHLGDSENNQCVAKKTSGGVGVGVGGSAASGTFDLALQSTIPQPKPALKRKEPFTLPEWLEPCRDVWDAWVEARTKIKHPPTDWAKQLAVVKLEGLKAEGHNIRALLAEAAFHNWQSFYVKDPR